MAIIKKTDGQMDISRCIKTWKNKIKGNSKMKIEWDNYEHLCYKARYEIFSFIGFYLYISPVNDDNGCMDGYRIEIYFQDDIFKEQYCWGKSKDDEDIEEVKENAVELLEEAIKEFNKRLDTKLKEFKNEK